jgi:hypothetical protein
MYLLTFPYAQKVVYSVFKLKRDKKDERLVHFRGLDQFAYARESGMAEYVAQELYELVSFAEARKILEYLKAK